MVAAHNITGSGITSLRTALSLAPRELAELLGVHTVTVYRWEGHAARTPRLDPLHAQLLTLLQVETDRRGTPRRRAEFGSRMRTAIALGGGLLGLYNLLDAAFGERSPSGELP